MQPTHHVTDTVTGMPTQDGNPATMFDFALTCEASGDTVNALVWTRRAVEKGFAPATLQLAVWTVTGTYVERDAVQGARHILDIARQGDLQACRLMVNLCASGTGIEQSWEKATSWLCRAAKAGDAAALLQLGVLLRPLPRLLILRRTLLYAAACGGLPTAKYLLGQDLCADHDPTIKAQGAGWIVAAAEDGNLLAASAAEGLKGQKMRRPTAPELAARIPWAELKRLVALPHLAPMPAPTIINQFPQVAVRQGFLPAPLCDYMITAGLAHLGAATVHDADAGETVDNTRTNSFANFRLLEADLITLSVNARIMNAMGHLHDHGDPLSLLQYKTGQSYAPHFDFFDPAFPAHRPHLEKGGQRVKTGLLYLNDGYSGGATCFHHAGLAHVGERGSFLEFSNVNQHGEPDRATLHSGEPPKNGIKWILSKWAREAPQPL
ncbi:2OG-Fe(II) oxygenase [Kordiimonas aestuarii]|uniref:2OG-Fe(II) oxygenase n=1 Tax=Kordiimonas aestuarii TaxID=1005925 RepID=UPI0021D006E6|nr:2OG-Fe(II) oxygenase [Kordiimonas aestuarii]